MRKTFYVSPFNKVFQNKFASLEASLKLLPTMEDGKLYGTNMATIVSE